ncbi:MAG: hypothetical protein DMG07_26955 [Acidobacteria bacterium]|nr:MAG: hypothetical protein DMG07_26955 [Acidobacteriota bacterium]
MYSRTGRIVTLDNAKHLSDDDPAEWLAATEEYRALEKSGETEPCGLGERSSDSAGALTTRAGAR